MPVAETLMGSKSYDTLGILSLKITPLVSALLSSQIHYLQFYCEDSIMMKFSLLPIIVFLTVELGAAHASLSPELYWKSVLPTTPMPKSITDLLHSTGGGTAIHVRGKDSTKAGFIKYAKASDKAAFQNYAKASDKAAFQNYVKASGKAAFQNYVKASDKAAFQNYAEASGKAAFQNYVKASDKAAFQNYAEASGKAAFQNYVKASGKAAFQNYVESETQAHENPNAALIFLEKDLKSGHKMNLQFTQTSNQASFLPREVAKSIPFSSSKMAEILNKFGVKPGSEDADVMKNTIKECEETASIKGEEKYCATSLESMVDFSTSKLGKNVEALSTEVKKETKMQEYTITHNGVKKVGEAKVVVCHKMDYVYAVFYCHKIETTRAYTVSLEGADGSKVKAVSVCHTDTSEWNPKHLAFQVLKVKPGSVPVCHFLTQEQIVWVPKQT
ncbi:BURP domain-containing protein 3-like [Prosopis cineraria]|uniref:BURP domain-containing protein 3-like n=1 Tax=Prosopis cineraria TaxID=364024 RepID=UPI00240F220F|nr:BURP domain-containing protein 3-like [Prosopis cineraria]